MLKSILIISIIFISIQGIAQDECKIEVFKKVKYDFDANKYTPLFDLGTCELEDFRLEVFDSIGNKVYSVANATGNWDPSKLEKGKHYYKIKAISTSGQVIEIKRGVFNFKN